MQNKRVVRSWPYLVSILFTMFIGSMIPHLTGILPFLVLLVTYVLIGSYLDVKVEESAIKIYAERYLKRKKEENH